MDPSCNNPSIPTAAPPSSQNGTFRDAADNRQLDTRKRHPRLWFDDGNAVIVARDGTEFRIYRGPLVVNSPLFRDLFSLPQPHPESNGATELPAVCLDESREELEALLSAIGFGSDLRFLGFRPQLSYLSVIARLGNKYQFFAAVDEVSRYIDQQYNASRFLPDYADGWKQVSRDLFSDKQNIQVIELARLLDRPEWLPVAFMQCCGLSAYELNPYRGSDFRWGDGKHLPFEDVARVQRARSVAAQADVETLLAIVQAGLSSRCQSPEKCAEEWTILEKRAGEARRETREEAVFEVIDGWLTTWQGCAGLHWMALCRECLSDIRDLEWERMRAFWKRWPEVLGLEDPTSDVATDVSM